MFVIAAFLKVSNFTFLHLVFIANLFFVRDFSELIKIPLSRVFDDKKLSYQQRPREYQTLLKITAGKGSSSISALVFAHLGIPELVY